MNRREFLTASAFAGIAAASPFAFAATSASSNRRFRPNYAPHFGMFRNHAGDDLIDQIRFMADNGFASLEDNGLKSKPRDLQKRIGRELDRLGMKMGQFVGIADFGEPTFASGRVDLRERVLQQVRESVQVAKRVGARWCSVIPGKLDRGQPMALQTTNAIDLLHRCADICEPAGVTLLLEPLNHWRNRPQLFLSSVVQARSICRAVNRPSCRILFDFYQQHAVGEGVLALLDRAWNEIGYLQFGDNPGRKEPGTGDIDYPAIVAMLREREYAGVIGMEHGALRPGREGELAVIAAYSSLGL